MNVPRRLKRCSFLLPMVFAASAVAFYPDPGWLQLNDVAAYTANQHKRNGIAPVRSFFVAGCQAAFQHWQDEISKTGASVDIGDAHRDLLSREFGEDFIDRVTVRSGAEMQYIGFNGKVLLGVAATAQTFGHVVYLKGDYDPDDPAQAMLLAHEFTHVRQVEQGHFSRRYCEALYDGGFNYWHNALEVEAYNFQVSFAKKYGLQQQQ